MGVTRERGDGVVDPAVAAAPGRGWRWWVEELGSHEQDRVAAFGAVVGLGFLMGVLMLFAFAWLANEVLAQETLALDQTALNFVRQYRSAELDRAAQLISLLGSEAVLVFGAILLVLFVWQRRWGAATTLVLVTGGAQLLNNVLKELFQRTRPAPVFGFIAAQQFSFPSGHAMVSAAFYFYVAYLTWRLVHGRWRIVLVSGLVVLVLLIGVARIYLAAHYLSDVIAGYMAGFLWTDTVIIGTRFLIPRRMPTPSTQGGQPQQPARTLNR